ncbi:Arc family DNA-binding protein [Pectobacterium odoriferum]|uniref:Arc family DNA-binding protein n=1 Tax=Pectobacterium odoriferum TaxID=78398 RepID=UPI0032EC5D59
MKKEVVDCIVRMPPELKDLLRKKAQEECRSMNSEMVKRLFDSLKREGVTV